MYKLEFLPIAKSDIDSIIYYISNDLKNKTAARNLAKNFIIGANSILEFPFGAPLYKTTKKLKNEYRSVRIKNFIMFYTIDKDKEIITIVRVTYRKMNIDNILE